MIFSSEYETLAIGLLQSLYVSNPDMARLAIKRENFEFNRLTSLDIASRLFRIEKDIRNISKNNLVQSQSEHFIEHVCVQEVFDAIWSGEKYRKVDQHLKIRR